MNQADVTIAILVVFLLSTGVVAYSVRKVQLEDTHIALGLMVWAIIWVLIIYVLSRIGVVGVWHSIFLIVLVASPGAAVFWLQLTEKEEGSKKASLEERIKKSIEDSKK